MARPRKGHEIGAKAGIALRIPLEIRAKLDEMAARRNRSLTDEVRAAIDSHIARDNYGVTKVRK